MAEAERGVEPAGTPAARCRSVGFRYAGEGDDRECEDEYAHGRVQGRVGAGDGACRRFVSHEVAYEYGCQRRAERVEGRAELNELVAPFFVAAERFQHGIHHGVEHAHREARNEGSGEVDAVASRTPCEPHDAYACEAYCDGRQSGLFVPHPLEHHARRNAHERIGDEVGQVAELGLEVRGGELRFDDDAHRILQARDESYDKEQGEHHSDGQCTVVVSFCHVGMGLRVRPPEGGLPFSAFAAVGSVRPVRTVPENGRHILCRTRPSSALFAVFPPGPFSGEGFLPRKLQYRGYCLTLFTSPAVPARWCCFRSVGRNGMQKHGLHGGL